MATQRRWNCPHCKTEGWSSDGSLPAHDTSYGTSCHPSGQLSEGAIKLAAARAAKAEAALETMVRVNGANTLISRRALIERRVAAGARVTARKNGERVLMNPDGSWLDTANITKAGLDYAESLVTQ